MLFRSHHQVSGDITPFRHIFISIFFVSIGLLFDPLFSLLNWHTVIPVSGLILFVNVVVIAIVILALGYPPRVAVTAGILLSQIGEFSFLLLENAKRGSLIDDTFYQTILSSAVMTILLTPFLFNAVPLVMKLFSKIPAFGMPPQPAEKSESTRRFKDHIILCGYGTAGQDLAGALVLENIPFLVIEMNPLNIQKARSHGVKVLYGDAMNEKVLHEAAIEKAKAVVISFGDASGIAVILRMIQNMNPKVLIVTRCRYERDVAWLYELGADVVIMEELELSAELTRVILEHRGLSHEIVHTHITRIRARKEFLIEQHILKKLK